MPVSCCSGKSLPTQATSCRYTSVDPRSKTVIAYVIISLTLFQTSPGFYVSEYKSFEDITGKGENCLLRAISPFPTVFSTQSENFLPFLSSLKLSPANSLSLEESKIFSLGKG